MGGTEAFADPWPAISFEDRAWDTTRSAHVSKSQRRRVSGDYQASVVPQIAQITAVPLSPAIATLADEATAEIARFDGWVGATVVPFSAILLRSESAASSQIENLTASAKAIALAGLGDPRRSNATQVIANTKAMEAAVALADHLDADAILAMQEALLGRRAPQLVGWRDEQVWIGGSNFGPHGAKFVPPHHSRVAPAIDDLLEFAHRDDIPALVQAAIAHAQFETIHPFRDGNGRTGRALIHSLLRARGVTENVTIPVSAGLLTDTRAYFDALTAYRAGNPEVIVASLSNAALTAITNGRTLIDDLRTVRAGWDERLTARSDSVAWRIADHLLTEPAISLATVADAFGASSAATYRALDRLSDAAIISEATGKGRGRVWVAPEVLAALDAFAARAGRRIQG